MLISSAPIAIPVNTANITTEAVTAEAIQRPKIPQPTSSAENTATKNSTEFSNQAKFQLQNALATGKNEVIEDKETSQEQDEQQKDGQASANQKLSDNQSKEELQAEELAQVRNLQNRDREVRAHEQAHASVGGNLAGPANLEFTTGPDGKRYAVSGEVSIDVSKVSNDPAASIRKFEQVQRAALAPANPSSQDRKVAAQAATNATQARSELNLEKLQQAQQEQKNADDEDKLSIGSSEIGKIKLNKNSSSSQPLKSPNQTSNAVSDTFSPVKARRQAAQLNQLIANSGSLELQSTGSQLSVRA